MASAKELAACLSDRHAASMSVGFFFALEAVVGYSDQGYIKKILI